MGRLSEAPPARQLDRRVNKSSLGVILTVAAQSPWSDAAAAPPRDHGVSGHRAGRNGLRRQRRERAARSRRSARARRRRHERSGSRARSSSPAVCSSRCSDAASSRSGQRAPPARSDPRRALGPPAPCDTLRGGRPACLCRSCLVTAPRTVTGSALQYHHSSTDGRSRTSIPSAAVRERRSVRRDQCRRPGAWEPRDIPCVLQAPAWGSMSAVASKLVTFCSGTKRSVQ